MTIRITPLQFGRAAQETHAQCAQHGLRVQLVNVVHFVNVVHMALGPTSSMWSLGTFGHFWSFALFFMFHFSAKNNKMFQKVCQIYSDPRH